MGWLARIVAGVAAAVLAATPAFAADAGRRLVLVTLDGLDWTEVFRGADPVRAADRTFVKEVDAIRRAFVEPADRVRALMPFLHEVVARQGVLIGNRDQGSCMAVANRLWFSYPGYNEILTGRPDPAIVSNAHGPNRNVTFLEWLNRQPRFKGQVETVASWDVFADILNAPSSGVRVNAGWKGGEAAAQPMLARLQADSPRLWPTARLDGYTHAWALDALQRRKPRVLYIAYDETDDFAHDGRYDQVLWSARRADRFLAELWAALQASPAYRGRTTLIVTTDHGRGTEGPQGWRNHGPPFKGSDAVWLAAIGPGVKPVARPGGDCSSSSQVAASALQVLGFDWKAYDPKAGAPLEIFAGR